MISRSLVVTRRARGAAVLTGLLLVLPVTLHAQGPGVASEFALDGNLLSHSPNAPFDTATDWVPGGNAAASAVMDNGGTPLDPGATVHVVDLTKNSDQNIFAGSNKVFDDPNTYEWKTGSVPQKDDINHALVHRRVSSAGDVWVMMAGDRRATNGTSYIDFELLQAGLSKNNDGTFSSSGPHGGRTVGDLLVTLELTQGGSQATFHVQRWETDGSAATGYNYHDLTPAPGTAYAAANIDSSVWVPYGAFGSTSYDVNAFSEAALNLTQLLVNLDPCLSVPVVFVRTKSSASPYAELKDFVDPISLDIVVGAHAEAGPKKALDCENGTAVLEGSSLSPDAAFAWTAYGGGHIVSGENTPNPVVDAAGFYVLTVTTDDGCEAVDTTRAWHRYAAPSDTTIYLCNPAEVCLFETCDDDDHEHDSESGCEVHEDGSSSRSSSSGGSESDDDEAERYCFTADTSGVYCVVFKSEYDDDDCHYEDEHGGSGHGGDGSSRSSSSGEDEHDCRDGEYYYDTVCVTVIITGGDFADAGPNQSVDCDSGTTVLQGATTAANATYVWTAFDGGNIVSGETTLTPTVDAPGYYVLTVTSADGCEDSDTTHVKRRYRAPNDTTIYLCAPVEICLGEVCEGEGDDSDHNGSSSRGERSSDDWYRTGYCVHDDEDESHHDHSSGNEDDDEAEQYCFTPDTSGVYCFVFEVGDGNDHDGHGDHDEQDGGSGSSSRSTSSGDDEHGDSDHEDDDDHEYDTVCVTVIISGPPSITCPPDMQFDCLAEGDFGSPTVTGGDAPPPVLIQDSIPGGCEFSYTLNRMWIAANECGADTCVQTITVRDTTAPVITGVGADTSIACPAEPRFSTATATDRCDETPSLTYVDSTLLGRCEGEYSITRTWIAQDACGNTATASQTIHVNDITPPVITCASDLRISCDALDGEWGKPAAQDDCDPRPVVRLVRSDSVGSGDCAFSYELRLYWEARDACGNADTCVQVVAIVDTAAPVITCPPDMAVACDSIPESWGTATAVDNCDPKPVVSLLREDRTPGNCDGDYRLERYWVATDDCGNADTCVQTITVRDLAPPVVVCPPDIQVDCGDVPPEWGTATATDSCDPSPVVTFLREDRSAGQCDNSYELRRYWVATDACGNADTCYQTISVGDTDPPVVTCPPPVKVTCPADVPDPDTSLVIAVDSCDGLIVKEFVGDVISERQCESQYTITRTYRVSDACGNTAECTQIIEVFDDVPPEMTCLPDDSLECWESIPKPDPDAVEAIDNCGGPVTVRFMRDSVTDSACVGQFVVLRTYEAADRCGNRTVCVQKLYISNTRPPDLVCLPPVTVKCFSQVPPPNPQAVRVEHGCEDGIVAEFMQDVITDSVCPDNLTITRWYRAVSDCGDADSCAQMITVYDDSPPVIDCPPRRAVACAGDVPAPDTGLIVVTDNCGGYLEKELVSEEIIDSVCDGHFTVSRLFEVHDLCGNETYCTVLIDVRDTIAPGIEFCPSDLVVTCASEVPAGDTSLLVAADNCPGPVTKEFRDETINRECPDRYQVKRTYRATDACGNYAECTQIITVNDTIPPAVTCPADIEVTCASQVPDPDTSLVTASDNCGGEVIKSFVGDRIARRECEHWYDIERVYRATDACGNYADCVQTITVIDTIPPEIACPGDTTVTCAADVPAADGQLVTVTDNCGGSQVVNFDPDVVFDSVCENQFKIERRYWVDDACGNRAVCTQVITVYDNVPPVVTCLDTLFVACAAEVPPVDGDPAARAADNCDGVVAVRLQSQKVTDSVCENRFVVNRTYRATDKCGNEAECVWTIVVRDDTSPVLACPDSLTVSCAALIPGPNPEAVAVRDSCSGPVTKGFAYDRITDSTCANRFTVERAYWAADGCGNVDTCWQRIRVLDDTRPEIVCPEPVAVDCASKVPEPDTSLVVVSDRCGGTLVKEWIEDVVRGEPNCRDYYVIDRRYRVTDACGNIATCTQTITVADTVAPVIACPPDDTVLCNLYPRDWGTPTASDNCDPSPEVLFLREQMVEGNCAHTYQVLRYWMARDACGNADTCVQTITVYDDEPPVVTCPDDLIAECDDLNQDWGTATAVDNCADNPQIRLVAVDTIARQGECFYQIRRGFQAEDECGNLSDICYQTITVGDTTAPVCHVPNDTAFYVCAPGEEICLPVWAEDNCDTAVVCEVAVNGDALRSTATVVTGGRWCFTADLSGDVSVVVTCIDDCGNTCTDSFVVSIEINEPPVCHTVNDTTIYVCDTATICLPYLSTDLDSNLQQCTATLWENNKRFGKIEGELCFFAYKNETYTMIIECRDTCGIYCADTALVTVVRYPVPECEFPGDIVRFMCDPGMVTVDFGTTGDTCWVVDGPGTVVASQWRYEAVRDTAFTVVIRCRNYECEEYCEGSFQVVVDINEPPVVSGPEDITAFLCNPGDTVCPGPWTVRDPDNNLARRYAPFGSSVTEALCFVPDTAGTYRLILCAEDSCGYTACDTAYVVVTFNAPPECHVPNDTTIFMCEPAEVCLPFWATDPDGNLASCGSINTSGRDDCLTGRCPENRWCYTPQGNETVEVFVRCTDSCGAVCEENFLVTFAFNRPPVCDAPNDTTIFQCDPAEVSLPVSATDPDGNLTLCRLVSGPGSMTGNLWSYTPAGAETVTVVFECVDDCGAVCRDQFQVIFEINQPPTCAFVPPSPPRCLPPQFVVPITSTDPEGGPVTCELISGPGTLVENVWQWAPIPGTIDTVVIHCTDTCGAYCEVRFPVNVPSPQPPVCLIPTADTSVFFCQPGEIRLPVSATNGLEEELQCEIISGPGRLVGGEWVYNAVRTESFEVTVRCTDICGSFCEGAFRVDITLNSPPVCEVPADQELFLCAAEEISLPYSATDPDANLAGCEIISGPGQLVNGNWVYTPTVTGLYTVVMRCWDECEEFCESTFNVRVDIDEPPVCVLPRDTTIVQCRPAQVMLPVSVEFFVPGQAGDARYGRTTRSYTDLQVKVTKQRERVNRGGTTMAAGLTDPCRVISGPGQIVDGFWVYTPAGDEVVTVAVQCADDCGLTCGGEFTVRFEINDPPVCEFRSPSPGQCVPPVLVVPFSSTDPEQGPVTCEIVSGPGELVDQVWQYVPTGGETVAVTIRCTDTCGAFCEVSFQTTIPSPQPPVCVVPVTDQEFFLCGPGPIRVPVSASGGVGDVTCKVISGPGGISNGEWVYNVTDPGVFDVTVECTDACGTTCQGSFRAVVKFNSAPICGTLPNQTVSGCGAVDLVVPVSAKDADGNLVACEVVSGPGVVQNGEWLWTTGGAGDYTVTIRCTDECGAFCEETFTVSTGLNSPPVCNVQDQFFAGCDQVTAAVPLLPVDPDGNWKSCRVLNGPGVIQGDIWVYTSAISQTFNVVVECKDSCGATCTDEFAVTFDLNDPPVCNFRDTTITVCGPSDVVLALDVLDPDLNLAGCVLLSGPGSIVGNEWYYHLLEDTPVELTIQCTDDCGMTCITTFLVSFNFGNLNLCDFPVADTVFLCGPGEFCFDVPPGCTVEFGMGKVQGIDLCFEATEQGTYWASFECIDDCGSVCVDTVYFEVIFKDLPNCGPALSATDAARRGCGCPVRGDLDGDGEVTSMDLGALVSLVHEEQRVYVETPDCPLTGRADVNCDGRLDERDVELLRNFLFYQGVAPCSDCPDASTRVQRQRSPSRK